MKRFLALALAGVMLCAMPVMAASSPSAAVVSSSAEESVAATVAAKAAAENKSVGEYLNNAVVEVPGLEDAVPAAQGGHVIINGAPSNLTFVLTKPSAAQVTDAKEQAALLGGKVLNVFGTKSAISKFTSAKVNFYMKGVEAGQLIEVYQLVNGEWIKVTVAEIREDHVVVELAQHGLLVFVEVPAPAAN